MFRDLLILIFIILTIVFLWFSKGLIFAGGEEGIPFYDLDKTMQFVSYAWQDISGGLPTQLNLNRIPYFSFLKIFYLIGLPGFLVQALHFFIIMSAGTIAIYFLLRETVGKELSSKENNLFKLVPLIGAIFYLLNPFSMTQIWGRGLYLQFFPFALFPFVLLMFILGLKNKNLIFGLLGLLASVFFAGSFGNPSYIFSFWIIIFICLIFYIIKNPDKKNIFFSVIYFLFMLAGWVLSHMWWIYPFIKISSNQFSQALNNTEVNVGTLTGISKDYQLHSLLRLIHEGYFYRDQKFGVSYSSLPFILISWIIPLAALFSYKTFKKLKVFLFFSILFLFSLFICLGANKPTGWLFVPIFKTFPIFQAFRNPFEKFGIVLTIAYAPFFAIGVAVISKKMGRVFKNTVSSYTILLVLIFLVCGVFLWPIWTGQFTAGGIKISPWVQVPNYYTDLNHWLNEQQDDGRIIHFPINPGDGLRYSGWEHPYQGIEPGEYIFDRPSIGKNGQSLKLYYNVLLQRFNKFQPLVYGPDPDITHSEFRSEHLYEELAKLNVRYIILHKDVDPEVGLLGSFEPVEKYLETQKNIKKINSFGKLDIYKVEISSDIHLIYSPQAKVQYTRINPTLYIADIASEEPFDLYFLENFDPNWQVNIDGLEIKEHNKLFSYANSWKINKIGNFFVEIKYKPQDYVNWGMRISKGAVLLLSLICIIYYTKKVIAR
ncbi:MAG: alpha-(1-_3)-arabinofuranosyltransferase family protein [Patescibacteria group bacterium]